MEKPSLRLISAAVTDKGLSDKRPVNEDSYLELVERGLFAVADGVGGAQAGDFASQTAMEVLQEAFSHPKLDVDTEELLEMAIQRANESIHQMSQELPQFEMMATTIVTLHLNGNIATIGHVGDSRLYRLDASGNLFRETNDHSIVEEEVRAGRMTIAQAANHPSRNVISRALGAESAVEVEMRTIMFEPGTTFLLCSDGVTRHVSDYEIKEILGNHQSLTEACREIKSLCYSRGAEDNLTAVIVRVENAHSPLATVSDEENTVTGGRPMFAPNPLPSLTNNGQRGASATDVRTEEYAAMPVVSPEAATAPLEAFPSSAEENPNSSSASRENLASASPTINQRLEETPATLDESTRQPITDNAQSRSNNSGEPSASSYYIAEKSDSSSNKLLTSLLLLLGGAAIGAGLFYVLMTLFSPPTAVAPANNAPANTTPIVPPQVATATSDLSAEEINEFRNFERVRRNVDKQPRNAQTALQQPQTAADHYLLGRAYLQIGDYAKARDSLSKAAELISQSNEVNSDTLRMDIATAQAAVGAITQTASDRKPLTDLIKSKQSGTTQAAQTDAPLTNR